MYAECLNELGNTEDAYTYVNMVRARAQMRPLQEAYPEIGRQTEILVTFADRACPGA